MFTINISIGISNVSSVFLFIAWRPAITPAQFPPVPRFTGPKTTLAAENSENKNTQNVDLFNRKSYTKGQFQVGSLGICTSKQRKGILRWQVFSGRGIGIGENYGNPAILTWNLENDGLEDVVRFQNGWCLGSMLINFPGSKHHQTDQIDSVIQIHHFQQTVDPSKIGLTFTIHFETCHCKGSPNKPLGGMFLVLCGVGSVAKIWFTTSINTVPIWPN